MRCFAAVWPPAEVADALAALPRAPIAGLRWSSRDQWHVTLRFFGELGQDEVDAAANALAAVARTAASPLEARGGPDHRLLGHGLIVWPVDGLSGLADAVLAATANIGDKPPPREFAGHITLARSRGDADTREARNVLASLALSWPVDAITLVRSQLHPQGASYHVVAAFPLGAGPPAPAEGSG
jgi:2'-5' RNA ligase